jgi:hypothetical protein
VRLQLNEPGLTTLNAAGTGTVRIGPGRAGVRWDIRTIAVSSSSSVKIPTAQVFLGEPSAGSLKGGTGSGNSDSTDIAITLHSGQYLTVVWAAGDAGASAAVSLLGDVVIGE